MKHLSESTLVGQEEKESKAGDWQAEVKRALERNSPDRLLAVVSGIMDKQGETLTGDERDLLLRIMKYAKLGVKDREERWLEIMGRLD